MKLCSGIRRYKRKAPRTWKTRGKSYYNVDVLVREHSYYTTTFPLQYSPVYQPAPQEGFLAFGTFGDVEVTRGL